MYLIIIPVPEYKEARKLKEKILKAVNPSEIHVIETATPFSLGFIRSIAKELEKRMG